MRILNFLKKLDRTKWFVCYDCMGKRSDQPETAIFYYDGAPHVELGREWWKCPRCGSINTRSFQFLKDNGEVPDSQDAIIEYPNFNAIVQFREAAAGAGSTSMGSLTFMGTKGTKTLGRDGFEILPD